MHNCLWHNWHFTLYIQCNVYIYTQYIVKIWKPCAAIKLMRFKSKILKQEKHSNVERVRVWRGEIYRPGKAYCPIPL